MKRVLCILCALLLACTMSLTGLAADNSASDYDDTYSPLCDCPFDEVNQ